MNDHIREIRRTVRLIEAAIARKDYAAEIILRARWQGQVDRLPRRAR